MHGSIAVQERMFLFSGEGTSAFSQGDIWIPSVGIFKATINSATGAQKLLKALEGSKQGARKWYEKLSHVMTVHLGFTRLQSNNCVFIRGQGEEKMIVPLHVSVKYRASLLVLWCSFLRRSSPLFVNLSRLFISFFFKSYSMDGLIILLHLLVLFNTPLIHTHTHTHTHTLR